MGIIKFWDRQLKMLDLGFSNTSQNFNSFRQLFFIVFKGDQRKNPQNQCIILQIFQLVPPFETMKKMFKKLHFKYFKLGIPFASLTKFRRSFEFLRWGQVYISLTSTIYIWSNRGDTVSISQKRVLVSVIS